MRRQRLAGGSVSLSGRSPAPRAAKLPRAIAPIKVATQEEREYILALHDERPDLSTVSLSRIYFRRFGKDKSPSAILAWIKKRDAAAPTNPKEPTT